MEQKPPLAQRILRHPLTRLVLTLVVMGLLSYVAHLLAPVPELDGPMVSAWPVVLPELAVAVAASIAMIVVGLGVERTTFAGLGLRGRVARNLGGGFVAGVAVLMLSMGILAVAGYYRLGGPHGPRASANAFLGAVMLFFVVGVFEEIVFRGIMFRLLEQWLGTWLALLLTAAQFGLVHRHNPSATWASTVGIAVEAGILLAAAFVVTRSMWAPIGLHWAWNLFEGPVFGAPVSGWNLPHLLQPTIAGPTLWTGGAFGPEAGLACMVAGGGFGVALMVVAVRRGQILTPAWLRKLLGRPAPGPIAPEPPSVA